MSDPLACRNCGNRALPPDYEHCAIHWRWTWVRLRHGLLLLPTYLLYRIYRPLLPRSHLWRWPIIPFYNWTCHSTPVNAMFAAVGWMFILQGIVILGVTMYRRGLLGWTAP